MNALLQSVFGNSSKKLWVVVAAFAVMVLRDKLGLTEKDLADLFTWIGAPYLLGQGIADFGKGRTALEAKNGKAAVPKA